MTSRIRPQKPILQSCSTATWQELLIAMNKASDEVEVSMAALKDAQACENAHAAARHEPAFQFRTSSHGRKKAQIERKQIWDFVQAHRCEGARP